MLAAFLLEERGANTGHAPRFLLAQHGLCLLVLLLPCAGSGQMAAAGSSPTSPLQQASVLIKQGKPGEAIELLQPLTQVQPAAPGLEKVLGSAYFTRKDYRLAVLHLNLALQQAPQDWESMQLLALSYYAMNEWQQSIPLLLAVAPHLPVGQGDAEYLLGTCYARTQQWLNARKSFAAMFGVPAAGAMAHLMLAKMLVRLQLEDQAMPEIAGALSLDPRLPMAHFLAGEILLSRNNPNQALAEFQKEVEINPSVWLVYWRLGDTLMRMRRYDEAEKSLKQALWLNDSFTGSYLMLGEIELQKDDPELARGFLERAAKLDPRNYYVHYSLGRAYQKLGRTEDAGREFALQRDLSADKRNAEEESMSLGQVGAP